VTHRPIPPRVDQDSTLGRLANIDSRNPELVHQLVEGARVDGVISFLAMLLEAYGRYRAWAAGFGYGALTVIGMCAAACGLVLIAVMGFDWAEWRFLPCLAALGGPLASFDAYGAAAHRGRTREGVARALFILALSWGFAAYAFFWRTASS
jgi:hypothetical protein